MINSKQRSKLRSMAHHLKPIILIGKSGISDGAIESIVWALNKHELIKVKFIENKELKDQLVTIVEDKLFAFVVGSVGHTLIIFKYQEDKNKRKISI